MIGVFKPDRKQLPCETKAIYSLCYCSLCNASKLHYGIFSTYFISHEISQLLISILKYLPVETTKSKCHFYCNFKSSEIIEHEIFKRASEVSLILVWLKVFDAKIDKEKNFYRFLNLYINKKTTNIKKKLPENLFLKISEYSEIIKNDIEIEKLSIHTNFLAKELYNYILDCIQISDYAKTEILNIAGLFGNIITEVDYLIDFKQTKKCDLDSFYKIKNQLIQNINLTKDKIENLCSSKDINNYFKTCFFYSVKNVIEKIELKTEKCNCKL